MFENKRVFVIGSGPSLVGFDFSRLDGEKVVTINHAYALCRHDLHVFYDTSFLTEAKPHGYDPRAHTAKVLCRRDLVVPKNENIIEFRRAAFVTERFKDGLYMGRSSALPAINAALIYGASEVYLLGIDCRFLSAAEVREAARRNGNPRAAEQLLAGADFAHHVSQQTVAHTMSAREKESKYADMTRQFDAFIGRPVYNLSPFSALSLPSKSIDDVLKRSTKDSFGDKVSKQFLKTKNDGETREKEEI
jgi:hypothetical protein